MRERKLETRLTGRDLEQAERLFQQSGLRTMSSYVRNCVISGPAGHHPEIIVCCAHLGLTCNDIRAAIDEGRLTEPGLGKSVDRLSTHVRQLYRLLGASR